MDHQEYEEVWTRLLSTKVAVERVLDMLSSEVPNGTKSQPTSFLRKNCLLDLNETLSDLSAAIPIVYLKILQASRVVHRELLREFVIMKRIALETEDMLDAAAIKHLGEKVSSNSASGVEAIKLSAMLVKSLGKIFDILNVPGSEWRNEVAEIRSVGLENKSPVPPAFYPYGEEDKVDVHPTIRLGKSKDVVASSLHDCSYQWEDTVDSAKEELIDYISRADNEKHPNIINVETKEDFVNTSLGKLVCNDVRVSSTFDLLLRANLSNAAAKYPWICKCDLKGIIVEIIRSVNPQSRLFPYKTDLKQLKGTLRAILRGQKYLLVLDDFVMGYNAEEQYKWKELVEIFEVGSAGSTVILMTNYLTIHTPQIPEVKYKVRLNPLNKDQSWTLFTRYAAIDETETQQHPFLMETGTSIADKCGGNPLAIKAMGSKLRTNRDANTWKQVEGSLLWHRATPTYAALRISIEDMSHGLLHCFLTSAVLFEDNLMCRDQLIYFWIAHGLLQSSKEREDLREVGEAYCNELLWRAIFQVYYTDYCHNAIFQMHGEARVIAKDIITGSIFMNPYLYSAKSDRRALWYTSGGNRHDPVGSARTFLFKKCTGPVSKPLLVGLISKLRLARVMLLDHCVFEELPETIGDLALLRYLSIVGNYRLQGLPESICNLVHLQTLDLCGCVELKNLPRPMHCLWHLLLSIKLTDLPDDALRSWTLLHELKIGYSSHLTSLSEGISSLSALRVLWIHDCPSIASLPNSINCLANLKELRILNCESLDLTGWDGLCGLTCLQFLQLHGLPKLIEFPEGLQSASESLKQLVVSNCKHLKALPECLPGCKNLLELLIDGCPDLVSLPGGLDANRILQVPNIFNPPKLRHRVIQNRDASTLKKRPGEIPLGDVGQSSFPPPQLQLQSSPGEIPIGDVGQSSLPPPRLQLQWLNSQIQTIQCYKLRACWCLVVCFVLFYLLLDWCFIPQQLGIPELAGRCVVFLLLLAFIVWILVPLDLGKQALHSYCSNIPSGFSMTFTFLLLHIPLPVRQAFVLVRGLLKHTHEVCWHGIQMLRVKALGLSHVMGFLLLFSGHCGFEKDTLIQLWIAGGSIKEEPMEKHGAIYFEKLLSEGYISRTDSNNLYKVNAENLSSWGKSSFLRLESKSQNIATSAAEALHIAVVGDEINDKIFKTLGRLNKLRTLLFLGDFGYKLQQVPRELFHESLVALDLSGARIKELPSSAGRMCRLQYLDLSWTFIELLPEWITCFKELQTLRLKGCSGLHRLPNAMERLIKLRHLDLDVLGQLSAFPKGMGALVNLRTLSAFQVGAVEGLKITELSNLNYLTGEFCIAKLEHVQSAEAEKALLKDKTNVTKLELRWSNHRCKEPKNEDEHILENLRPHSAVEEIQLVCYRGASLPSWTSDASFNKLVSFTLFRCDHISAIPSFETLPALECLELIGLNRIATIDYRGEGDYAVFPKLQKLAVDEMEKLETWTKAYYPCLVELSIKDCPKLLQLPIFLYDCTIEHFKLSRCPKLTLTLESKEELRSIQQLTVEDCPSIEQLWCLDDGDDEERPLLKEGLHRSIQQWCPDDNDDDDDDYDDKERLVKEFLRSIQPGTELGWGRPGHKSSLKKMREDYSNWFADDDLPRTDGLLRSIQQWCPNDDDVDDYDDKESLVLETKILLSKQPGTELGWGQWLKKMREGDSNWFADDDLLLPEELTQTLISPYRDYRYISS